MMGGNPDVEAKHRVKVSGGKIRPHLVRKFMDFMYNHNPYAQQFKAAHEVMKTNKTTSIRIKTVPPTEVDTIGHDIRTYARPSASEVAMVIAGGGDVGDSDRDIILRSTDGQFKRISELHTGYLPLRYPLLFPYGQAGYDDNYRVPRK
jgi:hypothetical protein